MRIANRSLSRLGWEKRKLKVAFRARNFLSGEVKEKRKKKKKERKKKKPKEERGKEGRGGKTRARYKYFVWIFYSAAERMLL